MSALFGCPECGHDNALKDLIAYARKAFPESAAFLSACAQCETDYVFRLREREVEIVKVISAPGPAEEPAGKISAEDLSFRADPEYLHIWLDGAYFELPAEILSYPPYFNPTFSSAGCGEPRSSISTFWPKEIAARPFNLGMAFWPKNKPLKPPPLPRRMFLRDFNGS